ncbi:MAG: hypothetical protein KDE09_13110 [Anaerolineales bacterium]|nr:hypothetical protein [Anaerolineales bacterium]MCB0005072.1 hypothetical protein [Anaerolineales bacterium]MCB0010784.1 hypothetical protein [Anaerolineales bacterium]MCB0018723.1 hypothetical protein [Anaerolineales bacterium]MCB8961248.1 hypothetical protein [Ardenticatenales bacterium]
MTKSVTSAPPSPVPLLIIGGLWLVLAIAILLYQISRPAQIEISWTTETEFETAGFNIFRADRPDGDYVRLNERLIASEADPSSGATYLFVDDNVVSGELYYYVLEDVELSGATIRHEDELIAGEFNRFEWWSFIAIPVSVIVGLILLLTGLDRQRKIRKPH